MKRVSAKYKIFICLLNLIIFTGCGLKGNPSVISAGTNQWLVKNMKADVSCETVKLQWDFYDQTGKISYIAIEKSEVGTAGNECKDCPRTFERVGQVPVKGLQRGNNALSFADEKVIQGKIYNYKLMLCDDSDMCLEGATAEINFK